MAAPPPRVARLVGAAFTSEAPVQGWRHFHALSVRRVDGAWQVELAASCDAARRVSVPASQLLRREGWQPGWKALREL